MTAASTMPIRAELLQLCGALGAKSPDGHFLRFAEELVRPTRLGREFG
jgi:hypothetical protein